MILIDSVRMFAMFLQILVIARIILSWFAMQGGAGAITRFVFSITEPVLAPIRYALSRSPLGGSGMMMFDFSPLIFFLILRVVESLLVSILVQFL